MTVQELIAALQQFPSELEVVMDNGEYGVPDIVGGVVADAVVGHGERMEWDRFGEHARTEHRPARRSLDAPFMLQADTHMLREHGYLGGDQLKEVMPVSTVPGVVRQNGSLATRPERSKTMARRSSICLPRTNGG